MAHKLGAMHHVANGIHEKHFYLTLDQMSELAYDD